jgi:hypothetical protein
MMRVQRMYKGCTKEVLRVSSSALGLLLAFPTPCLIDAD